MTDKSVSRQTTLHRASRGDELNIHLISMQLSGMDAHFTFMPTYKRVLPKVVAAIKPKPLPVAVAKVAPPSTKAAQKRDPSFDLGIDGTILVEKVIFIVALLVILINSRIIGRRWRQHVVQSHMCKQENLRPWFGYPA